MTEADDVAGGAALVGVARAALEAAIAAVAPGPAVARCVRAGPDGVEVFDARARHVLPAPIAVLSVGKAAAGVTDALDEALPARGRGPWLTIMPQGTAAPRFGACCEAAHPVPDPRSARAGDAARAWAQASAGCSALVAVSGGASSLMVHPTVPLDALADVAAALLASGRDIHAVSAVRAALDALKAGGLARALAAAGAGPIVGLVLSDVPGDDLGRVGGGPLTAWPDHAARVTAARAGVDPAWPEVVRARLDAMTAAPPTPQVPLVALGTGRVAAEAARSALAAHGFAATLAGPLTGEAAEVGSALAARGRGLPHRAAEVYWGETTVTLGPRPGAGGRNQELALAAAIALAGVPEVVVGAVGTDGIDGPTPHAGAVVDGRTAKAGAREALRRHDSTAALGDAVLTLGPTGTNVADVAVVLRG